MSFAQIIFWSFLVAAVGVAVRFGGRDERLVAIVLLAATFFTPLVLSHGYSSPESGIIMIDILLFMALATIAMRSESFWPMWAAGFQLCALAVHVAAAELPTIRPAAYAETLAILSYPVIAALGIGTWLEARRRHVAR